jgi:hypothetical protein
MIEFKNKKDKELFFHLHPALLFIFMDMNWYSVTNFGESLVITDTISTPKEDKKLGRVSDSHQKAICIDIGVRNLNIFQVQELVKYINNKKEYENLKYLSYTGKKRIAYFHNNGNGDHIHTQINKKYSKEIQYNFLGGLKLQKNRLF